MKTNSNQTPQAPRRFIVKFSNYGILTKTAVIETNGITFNCVSIDGKQTKTKGPAKRIETAIKNAYYMD